MMPPMKRSVISLPLTRTASAYPGDLPYGTYIVEQISGKEGAELLPAFEVYIKTHADIYSYIINNAPITALIDVVKKDATTGKVIPAAGIGFKIRDLQSGDFITQRINYPTPVDIDVFYTDNTGRLRLPEPPWLRRI